MRILISLFVIIVACTTSIQAQNGQVLTQPNNQPVLIGDTHAESIELANKMLINKQISALNVVTDLTAKQTKCITKIEACRDKKLKKLKDKIAEKKNELVTLKSDEKANSRKIDKVKDKMSDMVMDYQKIARKATNKVRSILTDKQKEVFDKGSK